MTAPTLSVFPPAPVRGEDRAVFTSKANALVAHYAIFVDEINNTILPWIETQLTTVAGSVTDAQQAVTDAQSQVSLAADQAVLATAEADRSRDEADRSELAANRAEGVINYRGLWQDATGSATAGGSYAYQDSLWLLLVDVPDITATVPSTGNTDWLRSGVGEGTTLTKSFNSAEEYNLNLQSPIAGAPVVSVTKEVAQIGVSNNEWETAVSESEFNLDVGLQVGTNGIEIDVTGGTHVGQYLTAVTNSAGQINTNYWTDINSMTANDSKNGQFISYALSDDGKDTFYIVRDGHGVRNIVRNNGGTWEYNSNATYSAETWVEASVNTVSGAFADAMNPVDYEFDLNNASYRNVSFSVSGQETVPTGIAFSNDGLKMFIVGSASNSVHQYTLTSAFDVSSATYDNVSFSVAGQETAPNGIAFSNDGLKMFIIGSTSDAIYQYTLTNAFDISNVTYDNVSFSVAGQDTAPRGLSFSSDGLKMFIIGAFSNSVHQYTLSNAFDISNVTYDNVSFSVSGQETAPTGFAFSNDGLKMFISGISENTIYQYTLTNAFDVSNVTYDNISFSVAGQVGHVRNLAFSSDGLKMFAVDLTSDAIYQYSLARDIDISNATYDNVSFSVVGQENLPTGIAFSNDGLKMFIIGSTSDSVHQYTLSNAFDVSNVTYDNVSFSVAGQESNPRGLSFSNDGLKMFIIGNISDSVHQYTLTNAFDISNVIYDNVSFSVSGQESNPYAVTFSNDGLKMFIIGTNSDSVHQYTLTNAFDISNVIYDNVSFSVAGQDSSPMGLTFSTNGLKMSIVGFDSDAIYQYTLTNAFDVSNVTYDNVSFSVAGQESNPRGLSFSNDGLKMFIIGNSSGSVHQYSIPVERENAMPPEQLAAATDADFPDTTTTLDLAVILKTDNTGVTPTSNGVTINYDGNVAHEVARNGTDYVVQKLANDTVRLKWTGSAANTKWRVL